MRRTFGFPYFMLFITCVCHSNEKFLNLFLVENFFVIDCEVSILNIGKFEFSVLFSVKLVSDITHYIHYSKLSSNFLMRCIHLQRIFSHVSKRMI